MTDIHLTGVPEELAARIESAWDEAVKEIPRDDIERFWALRLEREVALLAAYDELAGLGVSKLVSKPLIDARCLVQEDVREARRNLERVRSAAAAVSP